MEDTQQLAILTLKWIPQLVPEEGQDGEKNTLTEMKVFQYSKILSSYVYSVTTPTKAT